MLKQVAHWVLLILIYEVCVMAFKVIKEWFFAGLSKHRSRHGQIVVSNVGDAMVVLRFAPKTVKVYFQDQEPPIDPCSPHPHDTLDFSLVWLGGGKWGIKIAWSVFAVRHVKYEIEGIA